MPILPEIYAATAEKEVVRLPGGCTVSHIQYKQLKDFMEAPSIDQWYKISFSLLINIIYLNIYEITIA